jgi:(2Fe-2S) ferredoxin
MNPQYRLFVCTKQRSVNDTEGCCMDCGASAIYDAFVQEVARQNLGDQVQVKAAGCLDHCTTGPVAMVFQPTQRTRLFDWPWLPKALRDKLQTKIQKKIARDRVYYGALTPADVPDIVQQHLINGKVIQAKVIKQSDP